MMNTKKEDKEATGKIDVDTPHDSVVQRFLRETATVKSFFNEYLPADIAARLDLRTLKYIVQIWDQYLADNKKEKYLPPVIPVVLYHGKGKWNLDTHFSVLFKNPETINEYIPGFRYLLLDISHSPDEEIKGSAVLKILLMSLKYI